MRLIYIIINLFSHKTGQSDIGNLFTYDEFKQYLEWQVCVESEGIAFYADSKHEYDKIDDIHNLKKRYTHIMWYDK